MNDKYRKHLLMLKERLENEIASLKEQLEELKSDLREPGTIERIQYTTVPIITWDGMERTGQFWFKNRFNPAEGYATSSDYRILYELQDEGPAFINETFGTFKAAKEYVEKYQGAGTVYRIISPDGEIVR